jgi:hypothetical protein
MKHVLRSPHSDMGYVWPFVLHYKYVRLPLLLTLPHKHTVRQTRRRYHCIRHHTWALHGTVQLAC